MCESGFVVVRNIFSVYECSLLTTSDVNHRKYTRYTCGCATELFRQ